MIKKLLFICLITVLLIGPVAAEQITMEVDSKRIEGMGTGHTPLDDNFCNIVYVISEREKSSYAHYIVQEYPITMKDYCKIKVGIHRRKPTRVPRPWDSPGKNTGVGCHFLLQCMKVKSEREVTQSCPTQIGRAHV